MYLVVKKLSIGNKHLYWQGLNSILSLRFNTGFFLSPMFIMGFINCNCQFHQMYHMSKNGLYVYMITSKDAKPYQWCNG